MYEKIENLKTRVKTHIHDHKEAYVVGGTCLAIGYACGIGREITVNINAASALLSYKSPVSQEVIQHVIRRGHPGYVVQRMSDALQYPSLRKAAEAIGVSVATLKKHLNGEVPDLFGETYRLLGEAGRVGDVIHGVA